MLQLLPLEATRRRFSRRFRFAFLSRFTPLSAVKLIVSITWRRQIYVVFMEVLGLRPKVLHVHTTLWIFHRVHVSKSFTTTEWSERQDQCLTLINDASATCIDKRGGWESLLLDELTSRVLRIHHLRCWEMFFPPPRPACLSPSFVFLLENASFVECWCFNFLVSLIQRKICSVSTQFISSRLSPFFSSPRLSSLVLQAQHSEQMKNSFFLHD